MAYDKKNDKVEAASPSEEALLRRGRSLARARRVSVRAVMCSMALLTLIGQFLFLRPTYSELEGRDLAVFPPVSAEAVMDGSFFSDASRWFDDTYPLREAFVGLRTTLGPLFGGVPEA